MTTDYISREAATQAIFGLLPSVELFDLLRHHIREEINKIAAADVVEVVRCGECIYRTSGYPSCQGRPNDWFCANGYGRNK